MPVDTVISGGRIVNPTSVVEASVAIDGESIVAVGAEEAMPEAERVVDASGKLVMPGAVDPHVHVDDEPAPRIATYEAETAAAALGGVTTFIDFAWQGGSTRTDESLSLVGGIDEKRAEAENAYVDYGLHGVVNWEDPRVFDEFEDAIARGVTSFKMFMSTYSVGVSNGFIHRVINELADHDAVAVLHTEDASICEHMNQQFKEEGKGEPEWYPKSRPDYAEAMAAEDAIRMALEAGTKYYGVHTTNRKAAEVIHHFREDGSRIRAETCTHYVALDDSVHERMGNLPLIAPPIRKPDDNEAMMEYLRRGSLDAVGTDHVAYPRESKEGVPWWDAPFGANSVQVSLAVFHDEAVNERGFSYPFLVRVMSTNAARTFGMPQKGTVEPGTDADLVVFDPNERYTITAEDNASNADYSMYEGREVTGRVKKTFVRGTLVADDGEIVADPGVGSFVEREIPDWSV